ncbi:MAG: AsmA family protein [Bacteroidales bacterium]|nr:AsmA family protein [Bacteroidales bacterium]
MKKFFKILAIIIIIIVLLGIALPFVFQKKIIEKVKQEANNSVNAKIDFTDYSLSLFRNFPNFSLELENLSIAGINEFENDTLASINSIFLSLDLSSVFSGDEYEISSIKIDEAKVYLKVLKNEKTNWDIEKPETTTTTTDETGSENSSFKLLLKDVSIKRSEVIYEDLSLGVYVKANGITHRLYGNLTEDFTTLNTKSKIDQLSVKYDGIRYLNNSVINLTADIDADLKNYIFTLKKNQAQINDLFLTFDGTVAMTNDDINLLLTFGVSKNNFKSFLSMIPAIYAKDFASIETKGNMKLDGFIKGIYNDNSMPSFGINIDVKDAMFKYPDLPKPVNNITLNAKITNKNGESDNTVIDVSKFHFDITGNPVDIKLKLKTPESDPDIDGHIKGTIDLSSVKEIYPIDEINKLTGFFIADIHVKGKLSSIEKEDYENFNAYGSLIVKNVNYKTPEIAKTILIRNAQLNFSPAYLDLVSLNSRIGKSDFNAKGKINDYLPYIFKNKTLKGNLTTNSLNVDLNELMAEEISINDSIQASNEETEYELSIIEVPGRIDFVLQSEFKKLIYDNMEMTNVSGIIEIKNKTVNLKNLKMNLLDGNMTLNGYYSTPKANEAEIDFNLSMNEFNIQKTAKTFLTMQKFVPIAERTQGDFSCKMKLISKLDEKMMPVYSTMTGDGNFKSSKIVIDGSNSLNKIAEALKMDKFKNITIDKTDLSFEFVDGKLIVKPFDFKIDKINANLAGWTSFEQNIDYLLKLKIPRNELGNNANNVLNNLVSEANKKGANFSLGNNIDVNLKIKGTVRSPNITPALSQESSTIDDLKKKAAEELKKKKEELKKLAKKEADKILKQANQQADEILKAAQDQSDKIMKEATQAANKAKTEASKQADKLKAEGKKNGFIAEIAAKKAAEKLNEQAKKTAQGFINEAKKQTDKIMEKARKKADKIKQDAENKIKK